MPSQILHTLFGEDVIAGIHRRIGNRFGIVADKALEKLRVNYFGAFALGCQGPDIFYHNRRRRPVGLEYGSLLHRRGAGIFTAGLLKMGLPDPPPDTEDIRAGRREKGINALGAYALGFMTHALLDRAAHPYIIYKSGFPVSGDPKTRCFTLFHVFFERILDVLMLKILRGKEVVSWDQEKLLAEICEKPPLGLRELLVRALILAFPERAGKDTKLSLRIENTLADCAGFYRATAPKNASPDHRPPDLERGDLLYLHPVNLAGDLKKDGLDCMRWLKEPRVHTLPKQYPPPDQRSDFRGGGVDFLNLQNQSWRYPLAGKPLDYRSFPQLYSGAVEAAVDSISPVIAGYLETGIFSIADAARAIGNSGLSITDETGKPCAPDTSDPLPLDKVLEEQAAFRGIA